MAQSNKLKLELEADAKKKSIILPSLSGEDSQDSGPIKVKKLECLNEFVAILVTTVESTIQLTESSKFKNEGIVVGVGPGLPDGSGGRTPSQLAIGDVVLFKDNNVAMQLDPDSGFYRNKRIVIISERSLICKLPKRDFELVDQNA